MSGNLVGIENHLIDFLRQQPQMVSSYLVSSICQTEDESRVAFDEDLEAEDIELSEEENSKLPSICPRPSLDLYKSWDILDYLISGPEFEDKPLNWTIHC